MRISLTVSRLRGERVRRWQTHSEGTTDEPLKYLPNFMANGKGILDVKLKHIVSKINLSMASNLCLSDSRAWPCQFVKLRRMGRDVLTDLRIHVHLPDECLGLESFLGKSNGIRSRQDVFRFLEGVVHFR